MDLDVPKIFWVAQYFLAAEGDDRCGGARRKVVTVGRFLGFSQILVKCDEHEERVLGLFFNLLLQNGFKKKLPFM